MNEQTGGELLNPPTQSKESLLEELKARDPRDYIAVSAFAKKMRSLDSNPAHPWDILPSEYFWRGDNEGEVAFAKGYNQNPFYLFLERNPDGEVTSTFLENIKGDLILDFLEMVGRYFPPSVRQEYFREIIRKVQELANLPKGDLAYNLAKKALELLPGLKEKMVGEDFKIDLPAGLEGKVPTDTQREQIKTLLELVRGKMPPEQFSSKIEEFKRDIPFTDDPYGENYSGVIKDFLWWLKGNYSFPPPAQETDLAKRFPIEELIGREISSVKELKTIIADFDCKPVPEIGSREPSLKSAEFVPLDKIFGGPNLRNWADICDSKEAENRLKYLLDMFQGKIADKEGILNKIFGISLIEVGGNYWVNEDGRHRVAILKALGVPFIPAIVAHY